MKNDIRFLLLLMFLAVLASCNADEQLQDPKQVLGEVMEIMDPGGEWSSLELRIHIREPRPQTPARFSELVMNNQTGYFRLSREYEEGIIDRIINHSGDPEIRLNGNGDVPDSIRQKYRLSEESIYGYRSFYKTLHGLPSTLDSTVVQSFGRLKREMFDDAEVLAVPVRLKESLVTQDWELLVSAESKELVALRFIHPPSDEVENEIIIFEGEFRTNGITMPRFRHWYLEESGEYLGSDILLSEIAASES